MNFSGKVILVTGAARGIGRATASAFAALGGTVAVHYNRSRAEAEQLIASLPGAAHQAFGADLADPDACEKLVAQVLDHHGRLDILVNNAGIFEVKPLAELDYAAWQATWTRTLGVDLVAPANLCYLAAQAMIRQGGGKITRPHKPSCASPPTTGQSAGPGRRRIRQRVVIPPSTR